MSPFEVQLRRDLRLGWAGRGDMAVMLGFFLIILTLVPLAVGPDAAFLQPIAVPMIWIAAMLSSLAGFTRIFSEDVRCGWVDQVGCHPCRCRSMSSPRPPPTGSSARCPCCWRPR